MTETQTVGIALVGCGTVGSHVVRLLVADAERLTRRSGLVLELRHVVDIDHAAARAAGADESICHGDLGRALGDERVHIVVELVGGETFAKEVVRKSLAAGKSVVTANKALLAACGPELFTAARSSGACIGFGASCIGGVPVIGSLLNGLLANEIDALFGIVNGTCNFILTSMSADGGDYATVLAQAQADGLAEADPTLDVSGADSAHKLAILASLAFGRRVDLDTIYTEGIDTVDVADIRYGAELGYTAKLLAIAVSQAMPAGTTLRSTSRQGEGVSLRVHPAFIRSDHPLAGVGGAFNAVCIYGHAVGHTMFYGRGAGGSATASAVLADIIDVACGNAGRRFDTLGIWPDIAPPADVVPMEQVRGRYYLRVTCQDSPGVLGSIADALGRNDISIASMIQHEPVPGASGVPLIFTTHEAVEGNVRAALGEINDLDVVGQPTVTIRIIAEHEETQM